mmetsp:Transcript_12959/g.29595  ORF Transcript_12959/g.29595 Transcript_12959/m.29595 type:complete len:417 (+) Transcript_12959:325-1575(+)
MVVLPQERLLHVRGAGEALHWRSSGDCVGPQLAPTSAGLMFYASASGPRSALALAFAEGHSELNLVVVVSRVEDGRTTTSTVAATVHGPEVTRNTGAARLGPHWPRRHVLDGEVPKLSCIRTEGGCIFRARFSIQPEHCRRVPIAEDRRHASSKSLLKLLESGAALGEIVADTSGDRTRTPTLRERHVDRHEVAPLVQREGHRHLKRLSGVDAQPARTVVVLATSTEAHPSPGVVPKVGGGVEGVKVSLLDVDLCAGDAADTTGIAVVVAAFRGLRVLVQRGEVKGDIATTSGAGQVDGVAERTVQQLHCLVLVWVPSAIHTPISKISSAVHMGHDAASAGDLYRSHVRQQWRVYSRRDKFDRPKTLHVESPRAPPARRPQEEEEAARDQAHGARAGASPAQGGHQDRSPCQLSIA